MVFEYLPDSYNGNMAAREQMHYAQCLAGMAFSNALLGIVHSMAHKTGAAYSTGHIPHGCANAIYLPYVIQYNAKDATAKKRYAAIAKSVGLAGNTDDELVAALCAKIDDYNVKPVSYTHLDVYKRQTLVVTLMVAPPKVLASIRTVSSRSAKVLNILIK